MPSRSQRHRRPNQNRGAGRRGPSQGQGPQTFGSNIERQRWLAAQQSQPSPTQSESGSGELDRNPYAVWTTGHGRGGGGITSEMLSQSGQWGTADFLRHHSDRSNSWAANNIRNEQNQNPQAYDFTFEKTDDQGRAINGSAQGLELITPMDAKVMDIQSTYQGSGGLGCFVVLEFIETGKRVSIHHLDSAAALSKGQIISGGTVIGTQGAAGSTRFQYPTHVDIVGTPEGIEAFVRANQSGEFKTKREGSDAQGPSTPSPGQARR